MDRLAVHRFVRFAALIGLFVIVLTASAVAGAPAELPSAALGWSVLFHVERTAAVLAIAGGALVIGWRAANGELPSRLGQIEYASLRMSSEAAANLQDLTKRICYVEWALGLDSEGTTGHD